jgi:hypothetical protein
VDKVKIRRRLAASRVAPVVALPPRVGMVGRHNARLAAASVRWLIRSREHTNLTYDLTPLNHEHLAWFVAAIAGLPVSRIRGYLCEIDSDDALRAHVRAGTEASARRGIADPDARYGRRVGWYALVRALRPEHLVETGTDKGLGSCVLAAALLRNGAGRLTTIDINPESGYLISGRYSSVVDRRIGDSLETLAALDRPVDLFLHDSDHSAAYEGAEFRAISPHLADTAVVMSDNAHVTRELPLWAEKNGWNFLFFDERPAAHWYPGDGIGVATRPGRVAPGG